MGVCAFAKIVLNDTFEARWPFDTDMEARYLYLRDGDGAVLIGAFDVALFFRWTSLEIREALSRATGVPVERILLHEHQSQYLHPYLNLRQSQHKRQNQKNR